MNREQWIEERRKAVGGSDAAAVCGMSRWRSPLDIYLDKIGESPEQEETPDMRRGTLLEPVVRQMYCDETGNSVFTPSGIVHSTRYPWAIANIDAVTDDNVVVELKTSRTKQGWGDPGSSEIPVEYLFQVQHYMAVRNANRSHVAVLFGGFDFAVYSIDRDNDFIELMMEREKEFWWRVVNREPPHPVTTEDMNRRWPISRPNSVPATMRELKRVAAISMIKDKIATDEEILKRLEAECKELMGDSDSLAFNGDVIATWKTAAAAKRFDANAFKVVHPELYEQFLISGKPSRRFLIKDTRQCVQTVKEQFQQNLSVMMDQIPAGFLDVEPEPASLPSPENAV
jgi:putative phage-type endonuclease